jgi:hypothetical protein
MNPKDDQEAEELIRDVHEEDKEPEGRFVYERIYEVGSEKPILIKTQLPPEWP